MPTRKGVKLKEQPAPIDIRWYREQFEKHNTICEQMDFTTGEYTCSERAWQVYITPWTFTYVCRKHTSAIQALSEAGRAEYDKNLALWTYEQFLQWSVVHQNEISLGAVDEDIASWQNQVAKDKRAEKQKKAREIRKLRKEIEEQEIKPGMPDRELVEARSKSNVSEN